MRAEAFTVPKYPEANEDRYSLPDRGDCPFVLCDGASESYASCLWAGILSAGLSRSRDFTDSWLEERIREYEARVDAGSLSWSKRLAYERGSFSTFLSVEFVGGMCIVNAVGDSVAFAVNRTDGVIESYAYGFAAEFSQKPVLLSTKPELNGQIGDDIGKCPFSGELREIGRASHVLMLTDALAHWLMKRRDDPDAVRTLLDMDADGFREFVMTERAAKRLRFDDTTMIRIELRGGALPPAVRTACLPARVEDDP